MRENMMNLLWIGLVLFGIFRLFIWNRFIFLLLNCKFLIFFVDGIFVVAFVKILIRRNIIIIRDIIILIKVIMLFLFIL